MRALPAISGKPSSSITDNAFTKRIRDASLGFLMYFEKAFLSSPPIGTASISEFMKSNQVRRLKVLELGAGCGIVGIAFAQLVKCDMLLTDLEDAQEILGSNVRIASPTAGATVQAENLNGNSTAGKCRSCLG